MKKLSSLIVLLILWSTVAFSQSNPMENFRQNIPMYAGSAALLLSQTKIDPVIPDLIAKVLPEVADENVDGAIQAVANILYQRKGIKALDPAYTQYLDTKIRSLISSIKANDYTNIIAAIADISITTNDYVHRNFISKNSNNGNTQYQTPTRTDQSQGSNATDPINRNLRGPNGQTVYVGPRGGCYYFSETGNKVYLRSGSK